MNTIVIPKGVVKSLYISNWGDIIGYPAARAILPLVVRIPFLTPNVISVLAFIIYLAGSFSIFISYPYHYLAAAVMLPIGFILDDLDGQVARTRQLASPIGNYLDKVLDVFKIYILTASLGFEAYLRTDDIMYIFLAFTACFFFNYRYYIKLETVLSQADKDEKYLEKSSAKQRELVKEYEARDQVLAKSFSGWFKLMWIKHRMIFFVDEAEFALITSIGLLFGKIEWVIWILMLGQVINAAIRVVQRGYQTQYDTDTLILPVRK